VIANLLDQIDALQAQAQTLRLANNNAGYVLEDFVVHQDAVAAQLKAQGLQPDTAREKSALFTEGANRLVAAGLSSCSKARAFFVPGRIEVMGKHTDYGGGRSLLAATNKGFSIIAVDRSDDLTRVFTMEPGLPADDCIAELRMNADLQPRQGHWSNYFATAVRRLVRNFPGQLGVDIVICCDIPPASGMSTSSALICAVFLALAARNDLRSRPEFQRQLANEMRLCEYLGCNENGQTFGDLVGDKGVGTFGGSEDHTAIMLCKANNLSMYSYCPTVFEGCFTFPDELVFVIASSGSVAEKTGDKLEDYNNACLLAFACADLYVEATDQTDLKPRNLANCIRVAAAAGVSVDEVIASDVYANNNDACQQILRKFPKAALLRRFEQFNVESEQLVAGVASALATKDFDTLGTLVDRSQELTDTHLMNIIPETRWLPSKARELGAVAASAFGAGFGGSVWALVRKEQASAFQSAWEQEYKSSFPGCADASLFFSLRPGPGAFQLGERGER
jgi:galactokinase